MSAFPRIIQWARDLYLTAAGDGKPWSTGSSPTKVEPVDGLKAQGFRPGVTIDAENLNWLLANNEEAQRDNLVRSIFSAPRRATTHPAMVGSKTFFAGQGFEEASRWWNVFDNAVANTAQKRTTDLEGLLKTNTAGGYSSAGLGGLGAGVNRSIQPSDDWSTIGRWDRGVVYHAHGNVMYTTIGSYTFAAFDSSVKNLTAGYAFGLGKGAKRFDGDEVIPAYATATQLGVFFTYDAGFTLKQYACSAGAKSAMCTAHAFKRNKIANAAPQTIYFATQNQAATGAKCVVIALTNDATEVQTVLYEGAELYGAGYNMWCAPVFDDANNAWIIATSNAPAAGPSGSVVNNWNTRIHRTGATSPQSPTLIATLPNVQIIRLASLGGGNLVALCTRILNGGGMTIDVIASADGGETWRQTGRTFGIMGDGHTWTTAIGDTTLNLWWINQTEDYQTVISGPTISEAGTVTMGEPTNLVLPFANVI